MIQRREFLQRAGLAGGAVWVAPAIVGTATAQAAGTPPVSTTTTTAPSTTVPGNVLDKCGPAMTLTASDRAQSDHFGSAVSVSGQTVLIGSPEDDTPGSDAGSAYVFVNGTGFTEQAKLRPNDLAAGDRFGFAVDIDGNTAIVGAPYKDAPASNSGAAYIFTRTAGLWTQQARLTAPDGGADHRFGWSVAVDGNVAVVGAPYATFNGPQTGAAYVFVRTGSTWTFLAKLLSPTPKIGDLYGRTVDVSGDLIAVAAPWADLPTGQGNGFVNDGGAIFVYRRTGSTLTLIDTIKNPKPEADDHFGHIMAIDGNFLVAGGPMDNPKGVDSGAAYAYGLSGDDYSLEANLLPADLKSNDRYGTSLSICGDRVLVGAPNADGGKGKAYLFQRGVSGWILEATYTAPGGKSGDRFGQAVGVGCDPCLLPVVGAPWADLGKLDAGAAYTF